LRLFAFVKSPYFRFVFRTSVCRDTVNGRKNIFCIAIASYFFNEQRTIERFELSTHLHEKTFFLCIHAILKEKTHLRRNKFGACGSTLAQNKDTYHHGKEKEGQEGKEAPLVLP